MPFKKSLGTLFGFATLFMLFFYGEAMLRPNAYIFRHVGDAVKNYYTYVYHARHDASLTEFNGMQYPYGEHYLYTDCHPILTNIIQALGPNVEHYSIGIMNFLMLFSIYLTFFLVYFLLLQFKINHWLACLFAITITLLQPQIFRITGHMALSYSMAIPLCWILLNQWYKQPSSIILPAILFFTNLIWLFTHAYLGVIVIFFQGCFFLFYSVLNKRRRWSIGNLIFTAIPIILFRLFLSGTDNHPDRTDNPSGFMNYAAELDDLFLPHHPPLRPFLDNFFSITLQDDAWCYVGISFGILFVIGLFGFLLKKNSLFRKSLFSNKALNIAGLSAIVVFMFAATFPFKDFPILIDYFPIVKQFRGTGRFTWVMFYVFSVFVCWIINILFDRYRYSHKKWTFALIGTVFAFQFAEGLPYHIQQSEPLTQTKNYYLKEHLEPQYKKALDQVDFDKYQCLLPLPFFHIGSEQYAKDVTSNIIAPTFRFSGHHGIPIAGSYLTRTSIPESKNIMQLLAPAFYSKEALKDMDQRPILVVHTPDPLSFHENNLLNKSRLIFQGDNYALRELTIESFTKNKADEIVEDFSSRKADFFVKNQHQVRDSTDIVYFNDFENLKSDQIFEGSGSWSGLKNDHNLLASFDGKNLQVDSSYVISMWMFNGIQDGLNFNFLAGVVELNKANDERNHRTVKPIESEVINGNWTLVEIPFTIKWAENLIEIVTVPTSGVNPPLYIDNLLMYKKGGKVYRENKTNLYRNNHTIQVN